jgi:hypothetical protein
LFVSQVGLQILLICLELQRESQEIVSTERPPSKDTAHIIHLTLGQPLLQHNTHVFLKRIQLPGPGWMVWEHSVDWQGSTCRSRREEGS